MATCADIIKSAYRRAQVGGAQVPLSAIQQEIGLERLQGMYQRMSNGLLGKVEDYYLASGAYTATEQQRIYQKDPASVITIPPTISDPDASPSGTRAPKDGAVVIVVNPATNVPAIWLYNAILAKWQNIWNLGATDVAPLSGQFEENLKDMLAVLICDENSLPIPPLLGKNASLGKLAIATRFQTKSETAGNTYF